MMRQKADEGLPHLEEKTPNTPGETLSDMNIAPTAFILNPSCVVCLPVVSDSQTLIWVSSSEINLQLDGAAKLDEAFNRFPYLTKKQTVALAQRCSLHPDQVKVWFMAQRLRYGISWDYKDIPNVRKKLMSGQGKEDLQNRNGEEVKEDGGENKKCNREVKEPVGKKAGEVREEQTASEGRMMGENVRANERLEKKMKKDKDRKEEDKRNTQKKRKRTTVTDKMGKKRVKQGGEGVVERAEEVEIRSEGAEKECQTSTQEETTHFTRKKKKAKANKSLLSIQERSFVVPDELLDARPQLIPPSQTQAFDVPPLTDSHTELLKRVDASTSSIPMTPEKRGFEEKTETQTHAESTNHNYCVTDVGKLKELIEVNNNLVADGSPTATQRKDSHVADSCMLPIRRARFKAKTRTQLATMKLAFSQCQYPDTEHYNRLAIVIDIPRYLLVQWFGDMRYYVKKCRPRWLTQEQYSRVLANIRYRQYLNARVKMQPQMADDKVDGEPTWKIKLDGIESCDEEESVPGASRGEMMPQSVNLMSL
ncbi:homeobox and leucine zipper encoding b [Anoplopoma fimbria]|uniref:homeobox and leucine zipper encoding b n=1 Tax=Anoplopoma fimbria TaxID=229290 RepID=UPI0023EBFAEF|nr:homeobox and leucine zipper encoding b [Anoplopoma fimbria]